MRKEDMKTLSPELSNKLEKRTITLERPFLRLIAAKFQQFGNVDQEPRIVKILVSFDSIIHCQEMIPGN